MGVLGGDNAGFPNGRRLGDDVVDIEEQAVAGFLKGKKVPLGDGVNGNDVAYLSHFPYVSTPHAGLREHEGDAARDPCDTEGPRAVRALRSPPTNDGAMSNTNPDRTRRPRRRRLRRLLRRRVLLLAVHRRPRHSPAPSRPRTSRPASRSTPSTAPLVAEPPVDARARTRRTSTRWALLGLAYQQRARETGDPSYYTKSDGALRAGARARLEGLPRLQRPRLARALATPLPRGAHARRAGARARADDRRATTA